VEVSVSTTTRKARLQAQRRALVAGGPLDPVVSGKARSPSEYLASVRAALSPTDVGPALAKLFLHAVDAKNVGLLKLLLPYVLGAPQESAENNNSALEMLMSAMRSEPKPAPTLIDVQPNKENADEPGPGTSTSPAERPGGGVAD
jgi:hypothetical protein